MPRRAARRQLEDRTDRGTNLTLTLRLDLAIVEYTGWCTARVSTADSATSHPTKTNGSVIHQTRSRQTGPRSPSLQLDDRNGCPPHPLRRPHPRPQLTTHR
jgi:hypothetical protein